MKYLKYIFILSIFTSLCSLQAQEFTYFNKKLSFPDTNLVIVATLPLSDGYMVLGDYASTDIFASFIAKLDLKGDLDWMLPLDDSVELGGFGTFTGASLVRIDEEHLAAFYTKHKTPLLEDLDIVLVKFTIDGEIIWQKTYGVEGETQEIVYHLLHTKDGGFLLSGLRDIGHFHFLAIKTDSEGTVEWEKTYSLGGTSVSFYAYETLDGGYIFSGYGRSPVTDYDMYCVKTNDKGKLQWQKNYGTENNDSGGQVVPLNTGEYLLSGGIKEDEGDKMYIAKLNISGNIIWEREYILPDIVAMQTKIIIKPDNGFIGATVFRNEYGFRHPVIMNFDSRGDTLWTKPITADSSATIYIRDIEKIEGGYVLAGHRFSPVPQYGWILTIDEEGNTCSEGRTYSEVDFEGCDSTVVFTDIPYFATPSLYQAQVAPNPAFEQTTLRYRLPPQLPVADLKLYALSGALVREWRLEANEGYLILDIRELESGVYFYRVGDRTGKLVVE